MQSVEKNLKEDFGIKEKSKEKDEVGMDSDSEENMEGNEEIYWNKDFMEVKSATVKSLGTFAKFCPKKYIEKYYDYTLNQLEYFSSFCNEDIFFEVSDVYSDLMRAIKKSENNSKNLNTFWVEEVFTHYESFVNETDNQELVSHIFSNIYNIVKEFGKNIFINEKENKLNSTLDRIIELTMKLLKNELPCQIKNKDAEEDEIEHEEDIFSAITDICSCLSEKLGDDFHNYFTIIFPQLSSYLKLNHDEADRQSSFGVIAEVLKYTKISVKFYVKQLFNDIQKNLSQKSSKKNEELLRHIAYLIGVLFMSDADASKEFINQALNDLQLIFEKTRKDGKDNVIAALCRIIMAMKYNKNNFNLFDKSLETIMTNLPLKYDNEENLTVLDFLVYVSDMMDLNQYQKYMENIMKVLHCIVIFDSKCETKPEHIKKIKDYINKMNSNEIIKSLIESIVQKDFTPAEKEKFIKALNN